jgi:zinc and cadmium transporter
MELLIWILIFSLVGGVLSVVVASAFLVIPHTVRERILPHSISFAIGALLGAAFLAVLPHALENPYVTDTHKLTATVLIGLLVFFLLEKLVLWRHCHAGDCEAHGVDEHHDHRGVTASWMVLLGDGLHNFVDGVLIAAAFMTDIHLGIVTSLAVAAHEIPQEVGDFIVLLNGGFSRARALTYNILSSLTSVLGALLAYVSLSGVQSVLPYILAIAASSFIYIAVADLIPGLHTRTHIKDGIKQFAWILLGILIIGLAHSALH